ncbi:Gluconeogenesis factor OS=Lysinibacillus sphaericus OX=1421 GN=LS41612_04325 PE=3 SV=1 [Lysinibacillus sphaericus]
MFQYRFSVSDDLNGHFLGNLMLTALTDITGDFSHAISEMGKVLKVHGRVIPAANKKITLHAELEDGVIIEGESKIPTASKRINRVFLVPENVQPLPEAIRAINRADYILIKDWKLIYEYYSEFACESNWGGCCKSKGSQNLCM